MTARPQVFKNNANSYLHIVQLGQYPIPWWLEWFIDYVENAEKQHLETSSEIKLKGIYVFPLSLHVHIYIYIQLQLWILLINTAKDNNEARVCTSNPCETKAQTSVCFWSSVSFFFLFFLLVLLYVCLWISSILSSQAALAVSTAVLPTCCSNLLFARDSQSERSWAEGKGR